MCVYRFLGMRGQAKNVLISEQGGTHTDQRAVSEPQNAQCP